MHELVIFDWDGTLVDSLGRIVSAMQAAALEVGQAPRSDTEVKDIIGLELGEAISTLYPVLTAAQVEDMREHYSRIYVALEQQPTRFFDGVPDMLVRLRDQRRLLGVATGKSRRGLDRVMAALSAGDYFDATRCADETAGKPNPHMVFELLEELRVPPERAIVVGDSMFDLEMAARAGVAAIGVGWGAQDIGLLAARSGVECVDSVKALMMRLGV